jgi:mediator of RNA polymerase II transcription subunit 18
MLLLQIRMKEEPGADNPRFVAEYYQEGHRFVHENIVIHLHRVLRVPGAGPLETSPNTTLPAFDTLKPLDPSGGYLLHAYIRVQDLSSPAILDQGISELTKFKNLMKGCLELEVPDRLLFDTRVKWQPKQVGVR